MIKKIFFCISYIIYKNILLCLFIIVMISFFSNKVESVNDVTLNGEIEILGVIPNFDVE